MSPILQSRANASAIGYGAFSVAAAASDFESIATVTVGSGGAANVEFTSISGTYTHLQVRYIARLEGSLNDTTGMAMNFNSDTSSVYADHVLGGDGASVFAAASINKTKIEQMYVAGGGLTASSFGAGVIDILDYANTNKFKTTRTLHGVSSNASNATNYMAFSSGLWRSTSAITSIKFTPPTNNFAQYSHFALYGIKGA